MTLNCYREAQLNKTLDARLEECYHVQHVEVVPKPCSSKSDGARILSILSDVARDAGRPNTALRNTQRQIDDFRAAFSAL